MNLLIERIKTGIKNVSGWTPLSKHKRQLLHDCKAEIERLLLVNETLKGLCEDYQAQIKAQGEYVPMTDDELETLYFKGTKKTRMVADGLQYIQKKFIKRAGLIIKEKDNG